MKTLRKFISIAVVSALISVGAATSAHADTLVPAATETAATVTVDAVITDLLDGGQLYTYNLPDGGTMVVPYPDANFNPLTASDAELEELYFDPRPTSPKELSSWTSIMEHYDRGEAPNPQIILPESSGLTLSTAYNRLWSGWEVGQPATQASTYLAVQGTFKVPTVTATTSCTSDRFGIWLGLGGNSTVRNDLVQQGLIWCWGPQADFRPFLEFADTQYARDFCGYSSWTISSGHDVFQSLSYDTRAGVAKFWLSDLGQNGVTHNCAWPKISNWDFNGATAEWVIEALASSYPNYYKVVWTGAQAETSNDLLFHSIGSQPYIKVLNGTPGQTQCQAVSSVTAGDTFTITFLNPTC